MTDRAAIIPFLLAALLTAGLLPFAAPSAMGAGQVDVFEFPSAEMESRYRALIDEFRCPKCLNTNLSGSDAPIARDLRMTVWRLLVEEEMTDQQVRDYLQERYGDFVLYDPPFKPGTWILWLAPVVFGLIGIWILMRMVRAKPQLDLSVEDRARVDALLKSGDR